MTWQYELLEENEPAAPDVWRIFDDSDNSIEATICVLASGEHNNEALAEEICHLHNDYEAAAEKVPIPQNAEQAVGMVLVAMEWLKQNAPHRLGIEDDDITGRVSIPRRR